MDHRERNKLPVAGRLLLKYLLPDYDYIYVIGAYEQGYRSRCESLGRRKAFAWFWAQVLRSLPALLRQKSTGGFSMLKNYFKIALRNILEYKAFSFINIVGLAIGMACCILILTWVQDELSYDRALDNHQQVYRIVMERPTKNKTLHAAGTPAMLGPTLVDECPEVVNYTRVQSGWDGWRLIYGEKRFWKEKLAAVDPTFFKVFPFPFISGDPETALKEKHSIVISEDLARKCFGDGDPVGQVLKMTDTDLLVTGVMKNIPRHSHIQFDYAFPSDNMTEWRESKLDSWTYYQFATYIELHPEADITEVTGKINVIFKKHRPRDRMTFYLQPLTSVHLKSARIDSWMLDYPAPGNIHSVYLFALIAFAILLLACINFMNLTTARSGSRAREVGMRKVAGASRLDLIKQFMGESVLLTLSALTIAIGIVHLMLPVFNRISGKQLSLNQAGNAQMLLGLLLITLITGFLSGSYPALFLSAFNPLKILNVFKAGSTKKGLNLRRVLVVVQFVFTIGLIISTATLYHQLNFVQNKDLGYDREHILTFFHGHADTGVMRQKLLDLPNIQNVTFSQAPDRTLYGATGFDWEGKTVDENIMFYPVDVDYWYRETFGLEMVAGRFFSKEFATDAGEGVVINETAAKMMGMSEPIGKRITFQRQTRNIIGVIKDYHITSLHNRIEPLILKHTEASFQVCLRINPQNVSETIEQVQSVYLSLVKDFPFEYKFLDDKINSFYGKEMKVASLILYATILAVCIGCLGLFGLISFSAEQRTKEIGIRKVLGATVSEIVRLLIREFLKWFLVANVIAWPLAFLAQREWIQGFAYQPRFSIWLFILSSAVALLIALLTVIFQAVKAASANPVDSLRYE